MKKKYQIILYMPYRALTHNRVKSFLKAENATTQSQATAINSQNGVSNNGPPTTQKNTNNSSNKQPSRQHNRTASINFLMSVNAYGQGTTVGSDGKPYSNYTPGQGKGFPNATPQTSVGSTNTFSRRAIARRAVTTLVNNGVKKDCICIPQPIKNLKGQFHK